MGAVLRGRGYCDTCYRANRPDVRAMGKDANGAPDAPDMCFLCRQEWWRGKVFDQKTGKYVRKELVGE